MIRQIWTGPGAQEHRTLSNLRQERTTTVKYQDIERYQNQAGRENNNGGPYFFELKTNTRCMKGEGREHGV